MHDSIRGEGAYAKTKKNILDYIAVPGRYGKPAWKDIWLSMTINSLNYLTVEDLVYEWHGKVNKMGLQFHTPFAKGDTLMLPFGEKRNQVVDKIVELKKMPQLYSQPCQAIVAYEKKVGRSWNTARGLPYMGYIITRPYGKDKATTLYWKW